MRRYWIPESFLQTNLHPPQVHFSGDIFHHIFDVCRQVKGSRFEVIHGDQAHLVEVLDLKKRAAEAVILSSRKLPSPRKPWIILALAFPRPQVFDSILEKAVEMGVQEIWPLLTEHSFFRAPAEIEKRRGRMEKIIISSTQQSGRGDLMKIEPACSLRDLAEKMHRTPRARCLAFYEGEPVRSLKMTLGSWELSGIDSVVLVVGGEGGFSPTEVQWMEAQSWPACSLGDQVLRVETACMAAVSILKYAGGLMERSE